MLNWLEFLYKNPASLPVVILIGAGWILWRCARFLWSKDRRGFQRLVLPLIGTGSCIFLAAVPVAGYFYLYRGLPGAFKTDEIGVLIAEVPGDKENEWQSKYARAIREQVNSNPQLQGVVRVRLLERMLPADPEEQQGEALAVGRRLHAAFVLRPLAIEGVQEPWLTVIDQPYFSRPEARFGKEFPTTELGRLEELPLPSDVMLLARCMLAISFHRRGLYADSGKQFRELLSVNPLPPTAPGRSDLEVLYADTFARNKQFLEAEAEDRKAIALNPQNADAHEHLGIMLGQQEKADAAIAEFQQALALKADLIEAYDNIGRVLDHAGKYDEAIAQYRKALAVKPGTEETLHVRDDLAYALRHENRYDEAICEFRRVLAGHPKEPVLHYNLGNLYFQRGANSAIANGGRPNDSARRDFDASMEEYDRALRLAPEPLDAGEIRINRAMVFFFTGRLDQAISDLQTALTLYAGTSVYGVEVAHRDLARAFVETRRYEEAITEFRKALATSPNDPQLRSGLAHALGRQGLYDDAIAQYQEALRLDPNDTETKKELNEALQRKEPASQRHP
jgi:tetratricopeptide (TPR) repeat protein